TPDGSASRRCQGQCGQGRKGFHEVAPIRGEKLGGFRLLRAGFSNRGMSPLQESGGRGAASLPKPSAIVHAHHRTPDQTGAEPACRRTPLRPKGSGNVVCAASSVRLGIRYCSTNGSGYTIATNDPPL